MATYTQILYHLVFGTKDRIGRYIENQHEHHCHKTFEEEYEVMLKRAGIDYDSRYL